jgi:hypothetical protein
VIFDYGDDGGRRVFDPAITAAALAGCVLCGHPRITNIGVFIPTNDAMRVVVLRLRRTVPPRNSTAALAYALCGACFAHDDVTDHVEQALTDAAARVIVQ